MRKILLLLTVFTLFAVNPLFAQGGAELREKVQAELDKTDQIILEAEDLINSTDNPSGLAFLEQAKATQVIAKDAFAADRFVEARRATLTARDLVRKALKTARITERSGDQVLRVIEQAESKLERARDMLGNGDNPGLMALYDAASDNLKRAWDFYNTKQYTPAARLAEQVEKTAERIINGGAMLSALEANYERRLESVKESIDEASMVVADCQSDNGKSLLTQAEDGLAQAEQLASSGRLPAAMQALQRSRDLANRAFKECNGQEVLSARYQQLVSQEDQLRERSQSLTGTTRESVDQLLQRATEQLDLAHSAIDAKDKTKAVTALQAAQLALRQAEEIILGAD